jgi:ketosteroid isomerase-like protein
MSAKPLVLTALTAFALGLAAAAAGPRLLAQPAAPDARAVADQAFTRLTDGLAGRPWDPFFDLLADDLTFSFPMGKYVGTHQGKAKAVEFFRYVSTAFPKGLTVTEVLRRTGAGTTFVVEFRDEGELRGEPYKNRVAISLDVCGAKICGYREYFGSDGKSN